MILYFFTTRFIFIVCHKRVSIRFRYGQDGDHYLASILMGSLLTSLETGSEKNTNDSLPVGQSAVAGEKYCIASDIFLSKFIFLCDFISRSFLKVCFVTSTTSNTQWVSSSGLIQSLLKTFVSDHVYAVDIANPGFWSWRLTKLPFQWH